MVTFYAGIQPHLTGPLEKPVYVDSPRQLYEETRKRGLYSKYLEDSQTWRYKRDRDRWI